MKNTTAIVFILIVALVISFTGCSIFPQEYDYIHEKDRIVKIELVQYECGCEDYRELEVVREIQDIKSFITEFDNLKFYAFWGGPLEITENNIVIKFVYDNADFELVDHSGRTRFIAELESSYAGARGYFNESEFKSFIEKHLQ